MLIVGVLRGGIVLVGGSEPTLTVRSQYMQQSAPGYDQNRMPTAVED